MAYIRKLPSGRWQAAIRKQSHSFSKTFRTKAAAEIWSRDKESEIERGEVYAPVSMTVKDMLDRYDREVTEGKKGKKQESARIELLTSALGAHSLGSLSPEHVAQWAKERLKKVGSDTVRRDLDVLSGAIHTAQVLWGLPLRENVAQTARQVLTKSRALKKPNRRIRRISDEELERLLWELSDPMPILVCFTLETAMRRGELAKMRWQHRNGRKLLIPDDKSGKSAEIPLSSRAEKLLALVDKDDKDDRVFRMAPDSITQAFDRACERGGIKNLRFHDLRHEATSRLFERGLSIEEVATITRHSDWRSLKIYTHPTHDHISKKLG